MSNGVVFERPGAGVTVLGRSAKGTVIGNGATEFVLAGGAVSATTVNSGGSEYVYSGAVGAVATNGRAKTPPSGGVTSRPVV